jgi:hypothetical protein
MKAQTALLLSVFLFQGGFAPRAAEVNAVGYMNVDLRPGFQIVTVLLKTQDSTVEALFKELPEGSVIYKLDEEASGFPFTEQEAKQLDLFLSMLEKELPGLLVLREDGELTWVGKLLQASEVHGPYEEISETKQRSLSADGHAARFWRAFVEFNLSPEDFSATSVQDGAWTNPSETLHPGESAILFLAGEEQMTVTFAGRILDGLLSNNVPSGWSLLAPLFPMHGGLTSVGGLVPGAGDHLLLFQNNEPKVFTYLAHEQWHPDEPRIQAGQGFLIRSSNGFLWEKVFHVNEPSAQFSRHSAQ